MRTVQRQTAQVVLQVTSTVSFSPQTTCITLVLTRSVSVLYIKFICHNQGLLYLCNYNRVLIAVQEVYQASVSHDPEGILGTFSSIFHCFIGLQVGQICTQHSFTFAYLFRFHFIKANLFTVQIGKIVVTYKSDKSRVTRWVIWGVVTVSSRLQNICRGYKTQRISQFLW